jgi:hypothetical protein
MAAAPLGVRQNHSYSSNLANTKQAQVSAKPSTFMTSASVIALLASTFRWPRPRILGIALPLLLVLTLQLTTAYQQLARELASDQIKVVGTYTLGKVIGEGG